MEITKAYLTYYCGEAEVVIVSESDVRSIPTWRAIDDISRSELDFCGVNGDVIHMYGEDEVVVVDAVASRTLWAADPYWDEIVDSYSEPLDPDYQRRVVLGQEDASSSIEQRWAEENDARYRNYVPDEMIGDEPEFIDTSEPDGPWWESPYFGE